MNAVQKLSIQVIQEHFKTKLKPIRITPIQGAQAIYIIKYYTHLIEVNADHTIIYRSILHNKINTNYWKNFLKSYNDNSNLATLFAQRHAELSLYSFLKRYKNTTIASIEDPKYHECFPPRRTNNHKVN